MPSQAVMLSRREGFVFIEAAQRPVSGAFSSNQPPSSNSCSLTNWMNSASMSDK